MKVYRWKCKWCHIEWDSTNADREQEKCEVCKCQATRVWASTPLYHPSKQVQH